MYNLVIKSAKGEVFVSKIIEVTVRIKDEDGMTLVNNVSERAVPYIEEIDERGFRAAFHDLEMATLESRKEACELTISEYLESMSKKSANVNSSGKLGRVRI